MDLRLLQYFVAAAELEHIGKAADRLHISQSPLSRQIQRLEAELGLELFVRTRKRVRLTESGKWLLDQARKLLAHSQQISSEAHLRAQGKTGTISIAFISAAMWSGILPKALRRFQSEFPSANVVLRNLRSRRQMDAVASGRIDIGFVSTPATHSTVEAACVSEEPFLLVLPEGHSLARKPKLVPRDLDGARWILLAQSNAPDRDAQFQAAFANAGFVPGLVQRVTEPNTLLGLVQSGFGVGLLQSSARNFAPRAVKFRALPWVGFKARTYMIHPAQGRQPLADSFAALVPKMVFPAQP
ncbi:MAG: LysR substrate-binding domain-containing protein [Bryobacteraceae bacterium]